MKKLFSLFIVFFSILILFSCTVTKRKYTGGYFVSWYGKTPDVRLSKQKKTVPSEPFKIAPSNINSQNIIIAQHIEKTTNQKSNWLGTVKLIERPLTKNSQTNLIPKVALSKYSEKPINAILEHDATEKANSKTNLRLCRLFCLLEFVSILLIILIPNGPVYVIVFPLLFFILSLVFAILARKDGYKGGLHLLLISNLVFIIMMLIIGIVNLQENGI